MCPIQPAISANVCIIRIITSLVTGAAVDDSFIVNSFFSFITSHVYLCWVATKAIYTQPEKLTVVWKKRRGFICIALTSCNSIFPCLGFGEKDLSDMLSDTQSQKHVSKSSNTLFRLQILLKNVTSFSLPIATEASKIDVTPSIKLFVYKSVLSLFIPSSIAPTKVIEPTQYNKKAVIRH